MDDFAVFAFFCLGPVITFMAFGAALVAVNANSRRRAETQKLREDVELLRFQQTRLLQQIARLEVQSAYVPPQPVVAPAPQSAPEPAATWAEPTSYDTSAQPPVLDLSLAGYPLADVPPWVPTEAGATPAAPVDTGSVPAPELPAVEGPPPPAPIR